MNLEGESDIELDTSLADEEPDVEIDMDVALSESTRRGEFGMGSFWSYVAYPTYFMIRITPHIHPKTALSRGRYTKNGDIDIRDFLYTYIWYQIKNVPIKSTI